MSNKPKPPGYVFGRPTKYEPDWMIPKAIEMMSEGASQAEVAGEFYITRETLFDWKKKHKDFSDGLKLGQARSQAWWENKARTNLDNTKFNSPLWSKNMGCRFREDWTEQKEHKVDLDANVKGSISILLQPLVEEDEQ